MVSDSPTSLYQQVSYSDRWVSDMIDFYLDIGVAVMLRILKEQGPSNKYRRVFLKVFRAISAAYALDEEFSRIPQSDVRP